MNTYIYTKKDMENKSFNLSVKSNYIYFMEISNQIYLTKKIYLLHKSNHGLMDYLYFKDVVPKIMKDWAIKNNINNIKSLKESYNELYYINKLFINSNGYLYNINSGLNNLRHLPNINVYRSKITLGYSVEDNGEIASETKLYKDMLASDIVNIDVWEKQTDEVSYDNFRYKNQIPIWQKTMQNRHYDRDNEGYQTDDPERASLNNQVHGYNMDAIKKLSNRDR
jgi:hypothetical protein